MIKLDSKMLFVNFSVPVEVANLKATCIGQAHVHKNDKGNNEWDVDFINIDDISYMGVPIKGYDNWKKFKQFHLEMGIDFGKAIETEYEKVVTEDALKQLLTNITF